MNKNEQNKINRKAEYIFDNARDQWLHEYDNIVSKKLRSCNAVVYETSEYYILQSYRTIIAVIVKADYTTVDALRLVYGYTATSAQHIAKFRHDYTPYPWNYPVLTWRELN